MCILTSSFDPFKATWNIRQKKNSAFERKLVSTSKVNCVVVWYCFKKIVVRLTVEAVIEQSDSRVVAHLSRPMSQIDAFVPFISDQKKLKVT